MNFQWPLLANIAGVGIYKYSSEALAFLSTIIISRYLSPDEFGVIAMITLFYAFLTKFSDIGLSDAIAREKENPQIDVQAHTLFLWKGIILGLLMAILTFPVSWFFGKKELIPLGFCYAMFLFLYAFPKSSIARLRKQQKFMIIARAELIVVIVQISVSIVLTVLGFSYWSLVLPHFIMPFVYLAYLQRHIKTRLVPKKSYLIRKDQNIKSLFVSISVYNFIEYWQGRIDNLWVGRLYDVTTLGLYSRAYSLASLPVTLLMPQINQILLPSLSKNNLSNDQVRAEIMRLHSLIMALYFVPFVILFSYPVQLSTFLWGDEWAGVGQYLGLLCLGLYGQFFIASTYSLYLFFRGERKLLLQAIITGLIIISGIAIGAFISVEVMIYFYLCGLLSIALPVAGYVGFIRCFGFSLSQMIRTYGPVYIILIFLLICKMMNQPTYEIYGVTILGVISLLNLFAYIKYIKKAL